MPPFDGPITVFVNSFAHRWILLDKLIGHLQGNDFFQGTIAIAVFYFVWFQTQKEADAVSLTEKRQSLLSVLLVCIPAVLTARAIAFAVPYRTRPIFNPDLHLRMAHGFDPERLLRWSSFPSDHAVLFFALATGVFLVSRKAGLLLYFHAMTFVCLPRLYLGVHYTSDLLAGALLGVGFGRLASGQRLRTLILQPAIRLYELSPGGFYAGLFCPGLRDGFPV